MNFEENRLRTFQAWQDYSGDLPKQLACNGFFATGNSYETECFSCHKRTFLWQYGDDIRSRHMQLDTSCVFLNNPLSSGNVPSSSADSVTQHASGTTIANNIPCTQIDLEETDLKIESNRLATFANWPNPNITPQSLAKAGFYYFNRSDQVRCAWCKGVIAKWEKEDNAFEEHQRFFPECPRVQLGPLIEIASDGIRDLGIQQISPPKRPKYSSLDARLRTYKNWPINDIQRPEALAQAGLYYHEVDDQVRCFHCFIGLRSWQKEDDPWFEHAKWYPQCQFVRLVKGPQYVEYVQKVTRQSSQQQSVAACHQRTTEPVVSIQEAMCSPPVLQALEIGIDVGSIRTATQRRLELTGRPYDTVENLLKAVFGDPDDDDDDDDYDDGLSQNRSMETERGIDSVLSTFFRHIATTVSDNSVASTSAGISNTLPTQTSSLPPPVPHPSTSEVKTTTNSVISKGLVENATPLKHVLSDRIAHSTNNGAVNFSSNCDRHISLEEENRKLRDARLCKVCLDEEVGVVFLPCGHLVTCVQCAPGVNQCPMCRTAIKGFVRTFLS